MFQLYKYIALEIKTFGLECTIGDFFSAIYGNILLCMNVNGGH